MKFLFLCLSIVIMGGALGYFSHVKADALCGDGAYCQGYMVLDLESSCSKDKVGTYCDQNYGRVTVGCDGSCNYSISVSNKCDPGQPYPACGVMSTTHTGRCCVLDGGGQPTPTPGGTPGPTPTPGGGGGGAFDCTQCGYLASSPAIPNYDGQNGATCYRPENGGAACCSCTNNGSCVGYWYCVPPGTYAWECTQTAPGQICGPVPTPTPSPACTITLPLSTSVREGASTTVTATTTATNGTIQKVQFTSGDTGIFTATSPDFSSPYTSTVTGVAAGTGVLTAQGVMGGVVTCTNTGLVGVYSLTNSWWQVNRGATAVGNVISLLPAGKVLDVSTTPGVVISGGNNLDVGSGTVSSTNWKVANPYSALSSTLWTDSGYTAIKNRILSNVVPKDINSLAYINSLSDITNGNTLINGAYYVRWTNTTLLNINALTVGSNKVVIMADGDVSIKGNISLNDNSGFALILAGGNIQVDQDIGTSGDPNGHTPDLEGLFVADKIFNTGISASKSLRVEGTVATGQGINFQRRNLLALTPTELFVFRPDLIALMPQDILGESAKWQELAP